MAEGPWDSGLQPERTALAWLRTGLSFTAGGLVLIRFVAHSSTVAAVVATVLLVPLAALLGWLTWQRHGHTQRSLHGASPLPGGEAPAALAALGVLVGGVALFVVLA